jgi:hypothetical protein
VVNTVTDIVKQARNYVGMNAAESGADVLILDMADEIERLRAQLDIALSALQEIDHKSAKYLTELNIHKHGEP